MEKLNCWEYFKCGREPGGINAEKLGVCPAATETRLDGFHGGKNAGRACWAVAGTYCGGQIKGTIAKKLKDCSACEFHQLVIKQEHKYESAAKKLKQIKEEEKKRLHKEPSVFKHALAKARKAVEDNEEIESFYISMLIAFTSFCPNISMLQASKRLCKDDLVDELWAIDAIADDKRRRATKIFFRTVLKGIGKQVKNYFDPLMEKVTIVR